MRLVERIRLCYRMLVFIGSMLLLWAGLELEVLLLRKSRLDAINKYVPLWAKFNLRRFGVSIDARGKHLDNGETYPGRSEEGIGRIFIANHSSGMDIPLMFTVAETRVISRHDIANWPILGKAARRVGTLFVDRQSKRSGASVLRVIDNTLKRGEGVAMFPEGTALDGDQVHEFRPGAFNAARRAGAEIVPIGIAYGDERAYFSGLPFLPHMTRIAYLSSLQVAIEVGEPMPCGGDAVQLKNEAQQRVQALVDRARERLNTGSEQA